MDLEEATLRELRFVARALNMLAGQSIGLIVPAHKLLLNRQCYLDRNRSHRFDDHIADDCIERGAMHSLTQTALTALQRAPPAPVGRHGLTTVRVISHRHALATGPADHEPLQQRATFACRASAPIAAPAQGVSFDAL
jgi:hypothetical protein